MSHLQNFIESEKNKLGWWRKVVRLYPEIHTTSFLNNPLKQSEPEVILRPSVLQKLFVIPIILFALFFLAQFYRALNNSDLPVLIPLTGIFFILFILAMLIWHAYFNPRYVFDIRINHLYVEAKGIQYYWNAIEETCILSQREGKYTNTYLVLIMKDGQVEKMDLRKFGISDKKMAGIIEFYKRPPTNK